MRAAGISDGFDFGLVAEFDSALHTRGSSSDKTSCRQDSDCARLFEKIADFPDNQGRFSCALSDAGAFAFDNKLFRRTIDGGQ